jgi:hypothetical protein
VAAGLAGWRGVRAGFSRADGECRLDERQLAALEAGPLAGWQDQRWTLARVRDLVACKFRMQYTIAGIWYLLQGRSWTCQIGARRAIERADGAVEVSSPVLPPGAFPVRASPSRRSAEQDRHQGGRLRRA